MATFQDRANNACTAKIRLKGHNESRTFYPASGKSARMLAEKWTREEEEKILAGNYKSTKKAGATMLKDALDIYENEFAKKLKGYEAEKYRIESWRKWKYANAKLTELTEEMFNNYRDERRKYVSDGTIRLDFAVISALFSNTKYGIENPAQATISTLATAQKRNRRLKGLEQKYLLDALFNTQCSDAKRANKYLPLVAIFGIETACRLSEIVKDTREHTTGVLRENIKIDGDKSIAKIFDTKNGEDRFIPLTPAAIETIQRAKALNPALHGPLFITTASAVKQGWNRAKKRAAQQYKKDGGMDKDFLKDFHFHDLRHEAASRWKKFFNTSELKDLTGHKDIRSLSRYLHSDEDDIKEMAKKMAEIQKRNKADGDAKTIQFPENNRE